MKTFSTLAVAVAVLIVGSLVGFQLLTASASTTTDATCESRTVAKGEFLTSNLVEVDVYNASQRSGLANRVLINLQRKGFLEGKLGNSTSKAKTSNVTILTTDKDDPRVRLVAAQFRGDVAYAKPDFKVADGITVIIGDDYDVKNGVDSKAKAEIKSDRKVSVCVPAVPLA